MPQVLVLMLSAMGVYTVLDCDIILDVSEIRTWYLEDSSPMLMLYATAPNS